jgi:tRNA1Val (adenine37-N6)-methyltransferase
MPFVFKQFSIDDTLSTQKVGTDSMLLGSWASPGGAKRILDIGTGCGVLALMMAQKSEAMIDAIDIDEQSVTEAASNFRTSPWSGRLHAKYASLQSYGTDSGIYDYIITNPPFFHRALQSPAPRRNVARHDKTLPARELVMGIAALLSTQGRIAIILPSSESIGFAGLCNEYGLNMVRKTTVRSKVQSSPQRAMMEFSFEKSSIISENELVVLGINSKFSPEYLTLTADFHNF